ncbi:glycosyltransferase family 25 protein [Ovoidimarina sediminis]|uniref:glycosyltransferase family 25 protein n=1 Tax=Ovoidimarina sediminis TaxID=3079856 RepID=UPI0029121714|nr:glycosyltransferase family 25 protein [Rhodophyticola sp. MJ-SS7]MDU8942144.1 glycosyltransferase family 25 protein [Rhodophyticola sp. MJ-SS7]
MTVTQPISYLVNLERAVDRLEYVRDELARLVPGMALCRVRAIDIRAESWSPPKRYQAGRWRSDRWALGPSDMEIFASHADGWRRIAKSGVPGIVLEDDLLFSEHFGSALESLDASRPRGIVKLDGVAKPILLGEAKALGEGFSLRAINTIAPSCAAYWIDPNTAGALFDTHRIERTVDDFLFDPYPQDRGARGHGQPVFQIEPAVAVQGQFGRFRDAAREFPDCVRGTVRSDVSLRKKPGEIAGPLPYRIWKEARRWRARWRDRQREAAILSVGGRLGPPMSPDDLIWT